MVANPLEITYETIVSTGQKFCIGHSIAYSLHISEHYFVAYPDLPIRYLWIDLKQCIVHVFYSDGASAEWVSSVFDAYITQFGVAVSPDGKFIFAQTWENGLYCFSSKTGEKIWRTKSKAATVNLYVNEDTVCANRQNKRLELIHIKTGEIIATRKMTIYEFFAVDSKHFMCRTTSKKWEIIDSDTLETTNAFSADDGEAVRQWFSVFYG
jgi:outer membrane protein assembly factor BamB